MLAKKNFKLIYNHLVDNYKCSYDSTVGVNEFIHKNCSHASRDVLRKLLAQRESSFGDISL